LDTTYIDTFIHVHYICLAADSDYEGHSPFSYKYFPLKDNSVNVPGFTRVLSRLDRNKLGGFRIMKHLLSLSFVN